MCKLSLSPVKIGLNPNKSKSEYLKAVTQVIFTRGDGVTFIEEWEGGEQVFHHLIFLTSFLVTW